MKKNVFFICLLSLLLACGNESDIIDSSNEVGDDLVMITLIPSIWEESTDPIRTKGNASYYPENINEERSSISAIFYAVYDEEGNLVKKNLIVDKITNPDNPSQLTVIQDSLPRGVYRIVMCGGQYGTYNGNIEFGVPFDESYIPAVYHTYYHSSIVSLDTEPIEKSVMLRRLTGELEIFLFDGDKVAEKEIESVSLHGSYQRFFLSTETWTSKDNYPPLELFGWTSVTSQNLLQANEIPIPYCFGSAESLMVISLSANNHIAEENRASLVLSVLYKDGTKIEKKINPTIYPNTITRLKGYFMEREQEGEFIVEYEKEIGGVVEQDF